MRFKLNNKMKNRQPVHIFEMVEPIGGILGMNVDIVVIDEVRIIRQDVILNPNNIGRERFSINNADLTEYNLMLP